MMGVQTIRKKWNVGLELKKEASEIIKKKGGPLKTRYPNEIVSNLESMAPQKGNVKKSFPEAHKKSPEFFKEKTTTDNRPQKKTEGVKSYTKPNKIVQPEESRIVLMDIDPYHVHVYWEIAYNDKRNLLKELNEPFHPAKQIIRVYDVTHIHFDGENAHGYFDIEIDRNSGNWYIDLWSPHKSLCAEIGIKSSTGKFYPMVRSNFIDTPRADQSSSDEERWMMVSGNYEEITMLRAKPQIKKTRLEDPGFQRKEAFQEPEKKKTRIPSSMKNVESQTMSLSNEQETLFRQTAAETHTPPVVEESDHQKTIFEKLPSQVQRSGLYEKEEGLFPGIKPNKENVKQRFLKNDAQDHYNKSQSVTSDQSAKTETSIKKNTHQDKVASTKEDFRTRLFPEIDTHYGSDIRWENEPKGKK